MIFHASIPADDPEHVAAVLAELWGGRSGPFNPWPGSFAAMAMDERNSMIEVYPRQNVMQPGEGDQAVAVGHDPNPAKAGCFHMAVATPLPVEAVLALAEREGWRALHCNRGGRFDVIELWVENTLMIEALTPEMQADYVRITRLPTREELHAAGYAIREPAVQPAAE